jgi:predicted acetyltransferase
MNAVRLVPATAEQAPILANLLELYAHDFSEFYNVEIGEDGRFGYRQLPLYWSEPERYPFLIRVDGKLAGVVLVKRGSRDCWYIAEFFVLRAYRRSGIGTQVAHAVWRRFPGRWEVRVMAANLAGQRFWAAAIAAFTGESIDAVSIEHNGVSWSRFSFESKIVS